MSPEDAVSIVRSELDETRAQVARLRQEVELGEAKVESLERVYARLTGEAVAPPKKPRAPSSLRGQRSDRVARRRDAVAELLRLRGALTPTDILNGVQAALGDASVNRAQIQDVLRRDEGGLFRALGDGRWTTIEPTEAAS